MASVSNLDQDMRRLRMDRYTPGAAKEVRNWIESSLGEELAPGDLMESLRDGVALCKLINLCVSPGVKYKASKMPFVQMENISHFLRACEMPPLNLPAHDRFLTVDLYDQKDPAQVLQCIAAFSRRANQVNPSTFPTTIGAKSKAGAMSPENTGSQSKSPSYTINSPPKHEPVTAFNPLNKAAYSSSGRTSPTKSPSLSRGGLATGGPVSSWSKSGDENKTAPAWNIHQYGYMGGANQGNQGVAFGARRQIISAAPEVPSLAEKEKRLKAEAERKQRELEEEQQRQRHAQDQEELQAREDEERRWQEETKKLREQEQHDEEQKQHKIEAERQAQEDKDREATMKAKRDHQRQVSDSRLNGQFLSQYQSSQEPKPNSIPKQSTAEGKRIAELERQVAEAKEAAGRAQKQLEQERLQAEQARKAQQASTPKPNLPTRSQPQTSHEDDWDSSERDFLKKQWEMTQKIEAEERPSKPQSSSTSESNTRPLPDTTETYQPNTTRTERYLASHPAPTPSAVRTNRSDDFSTTTEVDIENQRRIASQQKTKAGGWASKSLLEREKERERERQKEWEEAQKDTASRVKDTAEGVGPGQTWDVHQYGYMGGDSQNRGGTGLYSGRRQIIGPRPPP